MLSVLSWREDITPPEHSEWKPVVLSREEWPPDYEGVWRWRVNMLRKLRKEPATLNAAKKYYATRPAEFIMHWMDTYDPRREGNKWIPFVMFKKQADLIDFFQHLIRTQTPGLIEKSRDMGATWLSCAFSVHTLLFTPNFAIGWGSRKEALVDNLGDPDSIFEKMRLLIRRLPDVWRPEGFRESRHATSKKIINPCNGAIIAGESGDLIGRGGRKGIFFKDESAWYERPEKIEAALGDNTNVQIDLSSVNGVGNVFHRRRESGVLWTGKDGDYPPGFVVVFIMDWRDHPLKTQEWYDMRKARYEREGMAHIFAQEVDRNYTAAVSNVIIPYEWVVAAVDAHIHIPAFAAAYEKRKGQWMAGLDVADDGEDRNALCLRDWVVLRHCEEWSERDPGMTARRAMSVCRDYRHHIKVMYDSIGLGSNVKSEYNRLLEDDQIITESEMPFIPWNAGAGVVKPFERIIPDDDESLTNKDFFNNLKAQGWWSLRTRFYKTFKMRTEGVEYDPDDLISLDSRLPMLEQIKKELIQPTKSAGSHLRMVVDKQPSGTKSPNNADSIMMCYFPLDGNNTQTLVGHYGH